MTRPARLIGIVPLALALGLAALLGCGRGPDEASLRGDIERRLDQHFEEGLFTIQSFRRMGAAPFRAEASRPAGLFV